MTGIFYDPPRSDEAWRQIIYHGDIIILSPTPEMPLRCLKWVE
jgi:hypothetical protein